MNIIVNNYDINDKKFNPSDIILDLKYIYSLIKKYKINEKDKKI